MLRTVLFLFPVLLVAQSMDSGYVIPPVDGKWIEAETLVTSRGKAQADAPDCFAKGYVAHAESQYDANVLVPWSGTETVHAWARVRGRGIAVKRKGLEDLWSWPKTETWKWTKLGTLPGNSLAPAFSLSGTCDIDALVLTSEGSWQPHEMPNSLPALQVRFGQPGKPVPERLVSANVNSPASMLIERDDWHTAVRDLAIPMMRFQVPQKKLDYRERDSWTDETFKELDEAVEAARTRWGVKTLLFGVHRIALPMEDDKLIEEEYPAYADAVARLVKRYASPGHVRVEYWEPFNELDHANFLKKIEPHGQDYKQVARLYAVCSQAIKAVNHEVKVGGPAAMWPGGWETKMILEEPGAIVDFVSWHQYAGGKASTPDEQALSGIHREKGMIDGLGRIRKAVEESGHQGPTEYLLTEYHINDSIWSPPDARGATAFSAVYTASVLVNLGPLGVDAAMIHDVRARSYGLVGPISGDGWSRRLALIAKDGTDDPIHMRPVGWVIRWFNQCMKGRWAPCEWVSTPKGWAASARQPVLEAAATVDGAEAAVYLINRETTHQPVLLVGLRDVLPAKDVLDRPVQLLVIDDEGPRTIQAQAPTADGTWRCTLPPMSVAVVRFERSPGR
jgi:hypothetical protein